MSNIVEVTDSTWDERVLRSDRPVVVDFWAPWCGPCRQFAPRFERAAAMHPGPLQFARCNVDTERLAAAQFGIVSIPTLGLFDPDGQLRDRLIGAPSSRSLEVFLSQVPHDAALPAD